MADGRDCLITRVADGRACLITRKKIAWEGDKQINKYTDIPRTSRLLDRIGPVGRFDENMLAQGGAGNSPHTG